MNMKMGTARQIDCTRELWALSNVGGKTGRR